MTKIQVNLTIQQLKNIIEKAERNEQSDILHFADDIITFHVEPYHLRVTQPIKYVQFGETETDELFSKTINTSYRVK